ncbi:MAG: hypothetical protein HZA02_02265 [Nitrospinae bacterium]|nr:hypothetical protein [Nitrospinota bacterium]
MRILPLLVAGLILIVSSPNLALGEDRGDRGERHEGPCHDDVKRLCGGIDPGSGRIRDCMREHRDSVSDACKAMMREREERRDRGDDDDRGDRGERFGRENRDDRGGPGGRGGREGPCHDDIKRLCGDVEPGSGRMRDCMREHKDSLSGACKEKMREREERRDRRDRGDRGEHDDRGGPGGR